VSAVGAGKVEIRFGNRALDTSRIRPGDLVWRTQDPGVEKALRGFTQAQGPVRLQGVQVEAAARVGEPLRTRWRVGSHEVAVESEGPLTEAVNQGLDAARLEQQLGRLGGTPYVLESFDFRIEGNPFAPASLLNQMRRSAVEMLQDLQGRIPGPRLHAFTRPSPRMGSGPEPLPEGAPQLHVLVRNSEQLGAALELRPASITLDYLDLYGLKPSVDQVRSAGIPVRAATPRILKPGEERILDFLLRLDCPLLIRPIGLLHALRERSHPPLTGDFSLNAANALSAGELLAMGLERITPTHDLNAAQIAELARGAGPARIEAILYQHLPVFHTEHCVFCRFLSTGTSYRDCGRPCEKHQLELRDSSGRRHPVIADVGCRNTVFGAEAQEASAHLDAWLDAGIRHFRIEAAHESGVQIRRVIGAYQQALAQPAARANLGATIRKLAPQGSTQGSLFVPLDHLTRPVVR
jgi:putative protease